MCLGESGRTLQLRPGSRTCRNQGKLFTSNSRVDGGDKLERKVLAIVDSTIVAHELLQGHFLLDGSVVQIHVQHHHTVGEDVDSVAVGKDAHTLIVAASLVKVEGGERLQQTGDHLCLARQTKRRQVEPNRVLVATGLRDGLPAHCCAQLQLGGLVHFVFWRGVNCSTSGAAELERGVECLVQSSGLCRGAVDEVPVGEVETREIRGWRRSARKMIGRRRLKVQRRIEGGTGQLEGEAVGLEQFALVLLAQVVACRHRVEARSEAQKVRLHLGAQLRGALQTVQRSQAGKALTVALIEGVRCRLQLLLVQLALTELIAQATRAIRKRHRYERCRRRATRDQSSSGRFLLRERRRL
mmetsp:Transcript_10048/g.30916  ORF Transcript_10048/g.30916 Transcript_10048/m.30916 type:complete len:355 (+) Transcript_10048:3452-4516(+)